MENLSESYLKTITTFLLSENPKGIKSVWTANRICHCLYLRRHRKDLNFAQERKELNQPALYVLLGGDEENNSEAKTAYIGETENFKQRITDHYNRKEFWNEALVFTARDNSLSKTEIKYLEFLAIEKAQEANNYELHNKQIASFPHLEENMTHIVKEFFQEVIFLTSFLNFNLFDDYKKTPEEDLWYCNRKGITAKGTYDGKKFIVLAGSGIAKVEAPSLKGYRARLVEERTAVIKDESKSIDKGEYYELQTHQEFTTPDYSASFCLGNNSKGWDHWKTKDGKTMKEVLGSTE